MPHALLHLGRHHPHCVETAAKVLPSAAERQQARDEAEMPVDLKMPAGRTLVRSGRDLHPNMSRWPTRGHEVGGIAVKLQPLLRVRARAGGGGATHEPFALAMMEPVPRPLVSY